MGTDGAVVVGLLLAEHGHNPTVRSAAQWYAVMTQLNWPALPVALADTIVPDFPLASKSFNLSNAGNDL